MDHVTESPPLNPDLETSMSEMFIQDPLINEEEGDNEDPDDGLEERLTENTRIIRYDDVDNEITLLRFPT